MPAQPRSRLDQGASTSSKHVAEQGRGLTQVEGRERARGGGRGREDRGPGPARLSWAGPACHTRGPQAGFPGSLSREQRGSGDPGRPPPGPGLRSTSASLFCPQTPLPPPSSPPLPPDWPLPLTVAWMRLGVWRSRNGIGPSASLWPRRRWAAGLTRPHCGVRNWASDPFCVGRVQQDPRVCRGQGGGGCSSPGSPGGGLRTPEGP